MNRLTSPGFLTALLTIASVIAGVAGKTQLASFLGSPEAADALITLVGTGGTLAAGILKGVRVK